MKKFSKILSVALLVALVLSLGVANAFAEGETVVNTPLGSNTTFTITVTKDSTDKAAHTYGAFQVFKGDLAETKDANGKVTGKVLSNIQWGDSIDPDKTDDLITELNGILGTSLATTASAADVAKAIGDKQYTFDAAGAQAVADALDKALIATPKATGSVAATGTTATITVPAGYYLVKDTEAVSGEGAETRFILQVVSDVTPTEKANVPSIEKKVQEKNDSIATSTTTPKNPTDYQDAADYDIGDDVPFQITATTAGTVSDYTKYHVTIQDKQSAGLDAPESYTIVVLGQTFTLAKDGAAQTATTNNNTLITVENATPESGNTFAIKVTFENNASTTTNRVEIPAEANNTAIVVTYTSKLNSNAVIGSLGNTNEVYLKYSNNPNAEDDHEGTTPKDKVIVFTYKLLTNKLDDDETTPLKGAGFTLYKWDASKSGEDKYVAVGDEMKGEDMTTFEFKGVDAGQYKLVETTVPAGYNKADDLEFKVVATYAATGNPPELTDLKVTDLAGNKLDTWTITSVEVGGATSQYAQGSVNVVNHSGTVLPSTGGIGTTIFYAVGGILVLAAIVLLITKKRMSD